MLLLWDRGFHSCEMIAAVLSRGAHVLGRLPATVKPELVRTLPDGTRIVRLRPADPKMRCAGMAVQVRLIGYTIDDPGRVGHGTEHRLVTTLLDPEQAPAEELVVCYYSSPSRGPYGRLFGSTSGGSSSSAWMNSRRTSGRRSFPCAARDPWE